MFLATHTCWQIVGGLGFAQSASTQKSFTLVKHRAARTLLRQRLYRLHRIQTYTYALARPNLQSKARSMPTRRLSMYTLRCQDLSLHRLRSAKSLRPPFSCLKLTQVCFFVCSLRTKRLAPEILAEGMAALSDLQDFLKQTNFEPAPKLNISFGLFLRFLRQAKRS
jgi:hypothetical protein